MEVNRPNQTGEWAMSFLDKAKELAERAKPLAEKAKPYAEKAQPYAEKAATLAAKGVDNAKSSVDKATKGKYHDQIETVSTKLGEALNRVGRTDPNQGPDTPKQP